MSDQQQKAESQENSSLQSSQDEQQLKPQSQLNQQLFQKFMLHPLIIMNNHQQERNEKLNNICNVSKNKSEQRTFTKVASLKKKRLKPNPPQKQQDNQELPINAENGENGEDDGMQNLLDPQVLQTEQQSEIQTQQLKMRLNPKLKIKEKYHVYIYLANCQDESLESIQELTSKATQFYSPQKQQKEQSSLNQINQEIFQETTIIIKNIKNQYQYYIDQVPNVNKMDYKDFFIKYLDKKYIESVLRDSKMQIQRKQTNDKVIIKWKTDPKTILILINTIKNQKKSGFSFLFVSYDFLLSSKTQLMILFNFAWQFQMSENQKQ